MSFDPMAARRCGALADGFVELDDLTMSFDPMAARRCGALADESVCEHINKKRKLLHEQFESNNYCYELCKIIKSKNKLISELESKIIELESKMKLVNSYDIDRDR
jgi:hypothetical protein